MWIMEQPFTILFMGAVLVVALVGGLIKTRKSILLYLSIFAVIATLALLVLERVTITPREAVRATLHLIGHEIEQNNLEGVLDFVSDGRPKIKGDAEFYMSRVDTEEVDIKNNLEIDLVSRNGLEIAEARFNCVVHTNGIKGLEGVADGPQRIPRYFVVRFKLEDDGVWRVRDYEMHDPMRRSGMQGLAGNQDLSRY